MFESSISIVQQDSIIKFNLLRQGDVLTYEAVIDLWQHNEAFRAFYITLLKEAPFQTYRWETPAVTSSTLSKSFEFVLINHPGLAAIPDRMAFRQHFIRSETNAGIAVFANLGRDAVLVVPSPLTAADEFNHLARFTRTATDEQNQAIWKTVGEEMTKRVSSKPVWLNTAGDGVSWLHIRLDNRPKYYRYGPYRAG